jgi:hypothetical protein
VKAQQTDRLTLPEMPAAMERVGTPGRGGGLQAWGAWGGGVRWVRSHRFDRRALPLADRHYNRQKVGSPQFVPPGRCVVLLTRDADALWVTSWPFPEYTKHAWAGAWVNSLFRNESPHLSSELIREAVATTRHAWEAPREGLITFVDASKVRSPNPGYCYLAAGFQRAGKTQGGLLAFYLAQEDMPAPEAPYSEQMELAI